MNRCILTFFIIAFLAGCQSPGGTIVHQTITKKIQKKITVKKHDTISIAAVGDIMLGSSYPNPNNLPPDSARGSFKLVLKDLQADITFGNLEGTLIDTGEPRALKQKMLNPYLFRMPTCYAQIIKNAGFNLISVANNHINDFGDPGLISTTKTLDSAGLHYAGLLTIPSTVFKLNDITYGFCSFAPNSNTVSILDLKNAAKIIRDLKTQADIVIVSFHGGAEGPAFEHIPFQCETYLGEKRGDVFSFAHNAIDAGADAVFGNGPHIPRAIERYKNRIIAYSLGNFCTYKCVSVAGDCGISTILKVNLNKKGEFLNGKIIAAKQTHQNGLEPDTLNRAISLIKKLTETDFPSSGFIIADDGSISII